MKRSNLNDWEKDNYDYINMERKELNEVFEDTKKTLNMKGELTRQAGYLDLVLRKARQKEQPIAYENWLKFRRYGSKCTLKELQSALSYKGLKNQDVELIVEFINLGMYRIRGVEYNEV